MSAFTDDDLKRLKERLDAARRHIDPYCPSLELNELSAILVRLEAAEKVCIGIEHICKEHDLHGQAEIDLKAWRQAAGK